MKRASAVLLTVLFPLLLSCSPPSVEIEAWHPGDIIGQGMLADVDVEVSGGVAYWLIELVLMNADQEKETTIYQISENLFVGSKEGGYLDTRTFKIGYYYVLYRKVEGRQPVYLLSERGKSMIRSASN